MFRRHLVSIAAAAAVALSTASTASAQDEEKIYTWRFQTLWQAGTTNQEVFQRFADNVETLTDGQVQIEVLPVGAIVGVTGTLDAVKRGILDGHYTATVYWSGRNPAFAILGDLNAAYETAYQQVAYFYEHGGMDLLREAYEPYGLYPIGIAPWGAESLVLTKDAGKPSELHDLKLRLPQGMSSQLFRKFGAVPVSLPGSEVFSALDKGVIDGTDWGTLSMNAELGFFDTAKYATYPGFHSMPIGDVTIRKEVWESLSEDLQKTLKIAVRAFAYDQIRTMHAEDMAVVDDLLAKGVKLIDWSDEERRKFREAAVDVWKNYAAKSDLAQKALNSQLKYLRGIGLIGEE